MLQMQKLKLQNSKKQLLDAQEKASEAELQVLQQEQQDQQDLFANARKVLRWLYAYSVLLALCTLCAAVSIFTLLPQW